MRLVFTSKDPWWCSCLIIAALGVVLSPVAHARALPGQAAAASIARRAIPGDLCFDVIFYWALPGRTNYCLGMKHWTAGDYHDALQLFQLAAGWGNKNAQYTLGLIYYNGHHVPANPPLGMAWLKLANERHNDASITRAAKAAMHWATPAQRAKASRLFQQMRGTYGDKVAAARAWDHLQHWRLSHGGSSASGCQKLYGRQAYYAGVLGAQVGLPSISRGRHNRPVWQGIGCMPMQQKVQIVQRAATVYFQGWVGTVTVEPLEQVRAPAASSSH